MRILHIGYRLPPEPGGLERHIQRLVREQLLRGHEVVVAHRRGEAPSGARSLPLVPTRAGRAVARRSDVLAFGLECAHALRRAAEPAEPAEPAELAELAELDVVHLHGDHREALALGTAARRLGAPLVLTVHGAITTRHLPIMPFAFRHVDDFIAIGARPAQDLRRAGIPAGRIATMCSGLDLGHIARHRGRPVEPGLVVSVGSLEKVKNHALTIEAFHALRATHPGARLVIAGEGGERAELERLAGTGRGVHLAGHLPESEVYALVGRAQAFVLSSRRLPTIGEGIPTSALEALALGTPVLLSSETSLEPIVEPGAYRTFRSGSVPELAARLRAVLDGDPSLPETVERGLRATSALDWPAMAARVEERYAALLPGGPRRRAATP
ncbi:glycosyltransferase family 4 protein [Sphaerisporangium dianthi]|uniref:Glycosyltransferase family 4 protein n=1 Tax=Sphaerisporangium dianthi TaxID=1436120 RepID=A0ABV9CGS5_9ACTN